MKNDALSDVAELILGIIAAVAFIALVTSGVVAASLYVLRALHGG